MAQSEPTGAEAPAAATEPELIRTTAAEARSRRTLTGAEDVVRRVAAREGTPGTVISTGTLGDVPPAERNPKLRREVSMSETVAADPDIDKENRKYPDLFIDYPIGNGQWWIEVERLEPKVWEGTPIRGDLPPIRYPMTFDEFQEWYGGYKYELIVYGPAHPKAKDQSKPKRYSKPIVVHVPELAPMFGVVPFEPEPEPEPTEDSVSEDSDTKGNGKTMAASQVPGRRPATNADARIHETNLEHDERKEDRRERLAKEREVREQHAVDKALREQQTKHDSTLSLAQSQLDARADEVRELREELKQIRLEQNKGGGGNLKDAAEVFKAGRPTSEEVVAQRELQDKLTTQHAQEIQRLMASHTAEITRLTERHADEIRTLNTQHATELGRLEDRNVAAAGAAESRIAAAETRATERIASVEARTAERVQQGETRIREVEARAAQQVSEAKLESDRRATDIQNRHTERVVDIERAHTSEVNNLRERAGLQVDNERGALQTRLDIKDQEISRLQSELDRTREEAKKPLTERINEVAAAAEALGFSKGDAGEPEKDWKAVGLEIVGNVAANFPEILRAAGDTFAKARQPNPAQIAAYTRATQPVQVAPALPAAGGFGRRRGGFATEDGPAFEGPRGMRPPVYQQGAPQQTPPMQPIVAPIQQAPMPPVAVQQQQQLPFVPEAPLAPIEAAPVAESLPPPSMPPSMPPPSMPPLAAVDPQAAIINAEILRLQPMFEGAYAQGATPAELAAYCLQQFGQANAAMAVQMITPERVLLALQSGGQATSRLCRRDGQKYLRETFEALKKLST